ncbi:glycosyltransferase family 2 protein [Anaerovibrio lipolyticus]|uniref:glycosyltransferase family 2 protein n=1 Tax=Anaerovibrio lipolyticus TaxID=82374 RepID=UPI000685C645|nr:glycosyltransferase family 2 protein [Anaerovibrio lipolyticus]
MAETKFVVKISIVTVSFNSAKTIEQTIKSVINQSYKNIEYIIIDGGSTDGTLDVIKKYEPYISYWVSEPDKGIYDAMNKGIKVATGDLIGFINSDDWYETTTLARYAKVFSCTNADVIYGDLAITDNNGKIQQILKYKDVDFTHIYTGMVIPHPTTLVKSNILKEKMFNTHNKMVSDYELIMSLILEGYSFQYIGEGIASYFRDGGVSTSQKWLGYREYRKVLKSTLKKYCVKLNDDIRKQVHNKRIFKIVDYIIEKKSVILSQVLNSDFYIKKNKRIVVFGAGEIGEKVVSMLKKSNCEVLVVDNSTKRQGEDFFGITIQSPNILNSLTYGMVLIANYMYSGEILSQINSMEIDNKIDVFSFTDWGRYIISKVVFGK